MKKFKIPTWYYQQFDADFSLDVPAEGYGGWKKEILPINPEKTAVVIMHAWDCGTYEQFPGWYRAVEYIPRANKIASEIFPDLLSEIRKSGMKLLHVASDSGYGFGYPGYKKTLELCEKFDTEDPLTKLTAPCPDDISMDLRKFKKANSFVGAHNQPDVDKGRAFKKFMKEAEPAGDEPVVINCEQLHAVCLEYGINHLIYIGFAINWCLQYSPGNMNDMFRRGFLCSTIREAVTAVENKESARNESNKEYGLWVTALQNGFVYDLEDFISLLKNL